MGTKMGFDQTERGSNRDSQNGSGKIVKSALDCTGVNPLRSAPAYRKRALGIGYMTRLCGDEGW